MPINNRTKGQKKKDAKREFKKWQKDRYPIEGIDESDDLFVPIAAGLLGFKKDSSMYYVSNTGKILSFTNPKKPICKKLDNKDLDYIKCDNVNYYKDKDGKEKSHSEWVHRIVWYSFYSCLKNDKATNHNKVAEKVEEHKRYIKSLWIENLSLDEIEIHHINSNGKDNNLKNLLGLPKSLSDESVHNIIHSIKSKGLKATKKDFFELVTKFDKLELQKRYGINEGVAFTSEGDALNVKLSQEDMKNLIDELSKMRMIVYKICNQPTE